MRLLKRYSANYQVLELEEEVNLDEFEKVSAKFDELAKVELKKMVDLAAPFVNNQQATPLTTQNTFQAKTQQQDTLASEKQLSIIKKQSTRAKSIATKLGIELTNKLTSKQASVIIKEIFAQKEDKVEDDDLPF